MPRPRYGNPQGPPDWAYSMPPPADMGPTNQFGTQPTDQFGYPINPGFSGSPSPTPYPTFDPTGPTGISPEPTPIPGNTPPPPGGWPIDVGVPTSPGGGGLPPGFMGPTGNFNYYDAGNGVVYVYDSNWNYVGTTNSTAPGASGSAGYNPFGGAQAGGRTDPSSGPPSTPSVPSIPWYAGAGPLPGGNTNPGNPGYVAPRATTSDVYTPGQSGWEGTGSSFNFLLPGGLSAKNI